MTTCRSAAHSAWLRWPVLLLLFASLAAEAATNAPPWFSRALVGMEVGPTGAQFGGGRHAPDYAANFNGRDIVRRCAEANVEAVVTDDPATRTLRVHLIAYHAAPQTTPAKERPYVLPGLIEDAPIFRVNLEFPGGLKSAKALNRTTQLKKRGQHVEIVVNDIHEVIPCRY